MRPIRARLRHIQVITTNSNNNRKQSTVLREVNRAETINNNSSHNNNKEVVLHRTLIETSKVLQEVSVLSESFVRPPL